jgi:SCY1-like protein 1
MRIITDGSTDPAQSDTYLLALLLFSLYNPSSPLPSLASQPTPSSSGSIPKSLFPLWKRMLNPNPRTRLATTAFVAEATDTGFWNTNSLANLVEGLDGFELRSESEKLGLLRTIKDSAGTIPQPFLLYRVLPSLLHSLSLPTAPSAAMLPLVMDLGKLVPPQDYGKLVLEPVVKLYTSPDRGTRMALLDGLNEYADKMDNRMVQEKVWPHLVRLDIRYPADVDHRICRYSSCHTRSYRQSCLPACIEGMTIKQYSDQTADKPAQRPNSE